MKTMKENSKKAISVILNSIPKLAASDWKSAATKAQVCEEQ